MNGQCCKINVEIVRRSATEKTLCEPHTNKQTKKKAEEILMIYILLGFTFPQYFQHFQFETQSEKKEQKQPHIHII